jgi:hypothetical protein
MRGLTSRLLRAIAGEDRRGWGEQRHAERRRRRGQVDLRRDRSTPVDELEEMIEVDIILDTP